MIQYRFNPWTGLGPALLEANATWGTRRLLPQQLADAAQEVARAYGRRSKRTANFEQYLELFLSIEIDGISDSEMHAAKFVVGKIFAANREEQKRVRLARAYEHAGNILELELRTGSYR